MPFQFPRVSITIVLGNKNRPMHAILFTKLPIISLYYIKSINQHAWWEDTYVPGPIVSFPITVHIPTNSRKMCCDDVLVFLSCYMQT